MTIKSTSANTGYVKKTLPWAGIALVLIVALWLRGRYLWVEPLSYDEGHWLMFGVLVNNGHAAYTETFVGIPPLALLTIQLGDKLFSDALAVRYPMMLVSLLGIAAIFLSFRPWQNFLALLGGILAALFLSFDTDYIKGSGSIMAEVPAVSLAIISFVLAQQYAIDRKRFWLVLSGITFALSLAFKIFMIFVPALVGPIIIFAASTGEDRSGAKIARRLVISGGIWFLSALLPWAVFAIIYNPLAMFKDIFLFRLAFREISSEEAALTKNIVRVSNMLINRIPLLLGATLGAVIGWRKHRIIGWSWAAWFILALFPLAWQSPLRERYAVMLLPPLAALSAIAIVEGGARLSQWLEQKRMPHPLSRFILIIALFGIIAWSLTGAIQSAYLPPSQDTYPDLNLDAVQYVWQNTTQDDCIVTDDQRFAFAANRLVPPALSETAIGRLATGWLTADDIVEQIVLYDCPMIVYADWRFAKYLPDLHKKLQALYFVRIPFDEDVTVYAVRKNTMHQPDILLDVQIGPSIMLQGVDISPTPWRGGQKVRLATYWTAIRPPAAAYKIFLQLLNDKAEPVVNFDHFPFPAPSGDYQIIPHIDDLQNYSAEDIATYPQKGMLPVNAWPVNHTIREVIIMDLPAELPPGTYELYTGLYDPDTLTRLLLNNGHSNFLLTRIEVVK